MPYNSVNSIYMADWLDGLIDGQVVSDKDYSVNGTSSSPTGIHAFSAVQCHCPARFM